MIQAHFAQVIETTLEIFMFDVWFFEYAVRSFFWGGVFILVLGIFDTNLLE